MAWLRSVAGLLVFALVTVACGARLDEQGLQVAIDQLDGRRAAAAGAVGEAADGAVDTSGAPTTGDTNGAVAAPPITSAGSTTSGQVNTPTTTTTAAPNQPQGQAPPASTPDDDTAPPPATDGRADTRSMPQGGNGGATDVGVTEDTIYIANVSDRSGAVQGLFEETQIAVQAAVAKFAATEGTIYGRRLEVVNYDSRMDVNGNRTAYLDACDRTVAAVGSMSAFDQGVTEPAESCGIPDIRATALTPRLQDSTVVYPSDAMTANVQTIGDYVWLKNSMFKDDPEAIKHAGYLFIEGEVTRYQTGMTKAATESIGYEWPVYQSIAISEFNYAPHVEALADRGVRIVAFQGAWQQAIKLAQAIEQKRDYEPDALLFQANVYHPDFIKQGGSAIEGALVPLASAMIEEMDQHPELQEYDAWVQRVSPGDRATALGVYAWSAAWLFIDLAKKIGPDLTREKLLAELKKVDGWDMNGLHPPQEIGRKWPSDCQLFTQVKNGAFVRLAPAHGFNCGGGLVDLRRG